MTGLEDVGLVGAACVRVRAGHVEHGATPRVEVAGQDVPAVELDLQVHAGHEGVLGRQVHQVRPVACCPRAVRACGRARRRGRGARPRRWAGAARRGSAGARAAAPAARPAGGTPGTPAVGRGQVAVGAPTASTVSPVPCRRCAASSGRWTVEPSWSSSPSVDPGPVTWSSSALTGRGRGGWMVVRVPSEMRSTNPGSGSVVSLSEPVSWSRVGREPSPRVEAVVRPGPWPPGSRRGCRRSAALRVAAAVEAGSTGADVCDGRGARSVARDADTTPPASRRIRGTCRQGRRRRRGTGCGRRRPPTWPRPRETDGRAAVGQVEIARPGGIAPEGLLDDGQHLLGDRCIARRGRPRAPPRSPPGRPRRRGRSEHPVVTRPEKHAVASGVPVSTTTLPPTPLTAHPTPARPLCPCTATIVTRWDYHSVSTCSEAHTYIRSPCDIGLSRLR